MAEDTRKPSLSPRSSSHSWLDFLTPADARIPSHAPSAPNPRPPPSDTASPIHLPTSPTTTDPSSPPADSLAPRRPRPKPKHDFPQTQAGKLWDALGNPSEPANTLAAGGQYNSAGGRPKEVTWRDAFSFEWLFGSEVSKVKWWQTGCARDSTLVGMGVGGAVGGLSFIVRGLSRMLSTTNYAVGAFAVTSVGMYTWCTARQREEAKGMAMAVVGMKMLNERKLKEKAEEEAKEAARMKEEEEKRKQRWKVW